MEEFLSEHKYDIEECYVKILDILKTNKLKKKFNLYDFTEIYCHSLFSKKSDFEIVDSNEVNICNQGKLDYEYSLDIYHTLIQDIIIELRLSGLRVSSNTFDFFYDVFSFYIFDIDKNLSKESNESDTNFEISNIMTNLPTHKVKEFEVDVNF